MERTLKRERNYREGGFTLVEVMFAVVILVGALLMAAKALSSAYETVNLQADRHEAMRHCQATLGLIRAERAQTTPDLFKNQRLPVWTAAAGVQGTVLAAGAALPNEKIVVTSAAQNGPTAITVTVTWMGINRRPLQVRLSTLLIDQ